MPNVRKEGERNACKKAFGLEMDKDIYSYKKRRNTESVCYMQVCGYCVNNERRSERV